MTLTRTDIAVLAYFAILACIGWWATTADRRWRTLAAARGLLPDFAPGGLADRAESGGLLDEIRYLANGFSVSRRVRELASHTDPDQETEAWRVRAFRRLHILAVFALIGWSLPAATIILPLWFRTIPTEMMAVVQALLLIGIIAILASLAVQFARRAISYGNGGTITLRRLVQQGLAIPSALGILALLTFLRG